MPALLGETKQLVWFEEGCITAPTSATLYLLDPAGAVVSVPPTVETTSKKNADGSMDVTLTASYLFALAGLYIVRWKPVIGTARPYWQCPVVVCKAGDVAHDIRNLLGVTVADIPDNVLDSNVSRAFICMQNTYIDEIPSYAALSASDALAFDQALALTVAAAMRPAIAKGVPAGELVEMTIAGDKFKYNNPFFDPSRSLDPIEKQWLAEADSVMSTISAVGTAMTAARTGFFATPGKRGFVRDRFGLGYETPIYDIYSDLAMAWDWAADYATWSE